jgi:glycosyltransferase involved in cell wall biosynthesis
MPKEKKIHVGIDATNISSGGGLTHLKCLLKAVKLDDYQICGITIWTSQKTASNLSIEPWLNIKTPYWTSWPLMLRMVFQKLSMPHCLNQAKIDVLFVPGGVIPYNSPSPLVSMSQNMLPFESSRANLFGRFTLMRFKIWLMNFAQVHTFNCSQGLIFLTKYARDTVCKSHPQITAKMEIIPHGIEGRFLQPPRYQRPYSQITIQSPFKIIYISILMPYKHQIEVAKAIAHLRSQGLPVELTFAGLSWGRYGRDLMRLLNKLDLSKQFLHYLGHVPFQKLHEIYQQYDCFLFASSCENLPNILIEAMASGLPIASSNRGPMPEILGGAGIYFNPEIPMSISEAVLVLAKNDALRKKLARSGWLKAQEYSWEQCARNTFRFIENVANQGKYI